MNSNLQPLASSLRSRRGFTLVELLVAMSLFIVIVAIAVTTFVQALKSQRAIVALVAINDNAGLFIEQLTREVRLGKDFSTPTDSELAFTNASGQPVIYELSEGHIERQAGGGTFVPQTASNINIQSARFIVQSKDAFGDPIWPRITVSLRVASKSPQLQDVFTDIQTTVSPRVL